MYIGGGNSFPAGANTLKNFYIFCIGSVSNFGIPPGIINENASSFGYECLCSIKA